MAASRYINYIHERNYCILCGASNFRVIHERGRWCYLRCPNCNMVLLHPRPTPETLMREYEDYLPAQQQEIEEWEAMMKPVVVKSADLIEARINKGKGRLLDIGCGYGFFLQEMKYRGWQVEGIEVSGVGRDYIRKKSGIDVYSQPLESLDIPADRFDVVTLFYVIEHVVDPLGVLKEVKRILKPDGLVLLRWPHSTPIVKTLGPLSKKLDLYHTPFHLYDFSPKTMRKILNLCGFRHIETRIAGNTKPSQGLNRWASRIIGQIGEALCFLSRGHILLPGVSKTTLARS